MEPVYERWQKPYIEKMMGLRRVLLLSGARQCGKTTLAKSLLSADAHYRTLDDLALLEAAQLDPHGFVKHHGQLLIIDEVQRAPLLLSAIKKVVDQDTSPGQYLLTGSANIQSLPGVTESLAGRITKIRLRPLTQGELLGKAPEFLKTAFTQSFSGAPALLNRDDILEVAMRGGFPEAIKLNSQDRRKWHTDYIEAILERDLKDILNIKRQDAMHQLIEILAAWSSKFMDISAMGSRLSIQRPTIESYINALEALYLVERVAPWAKTDYERAGKQYKLFMTDCGLMTSLLRWRIDDLRFDADRSGKLIESFVFNELIAQVDASHDDYYLYHYRDREKREIDFLIEHGESGTLLGIEVKAGSMVKAEHFKHLKWFKEYLAKDKPFIGIVLYTGEHAISFGEGFWAVPMNALWL